MSGKMLFRKLLIIINLFFFITNISAQKKVINIEDAIRIALENNNQVKISIMEVEKAEAAVREAFGYALPTVSLSANYSRLIEKPQMPFPDFEALLTNATYGILFKEGVIPQDNSKYLPLQTKLQSFAQTNNYEAKAEIVQILFNSAVFRGIGTSQIYLDLSREMLKSSAANTILSVKKAFYGVLLTKNILEITKASYNNAQENLKNVKAYYDQGFVSEFDALQAEVQVENIRPVVLQIENTLKNVKDNLKIVLGINQSVDFDVEGELLYSEELIPDMMDAVETALTNNYDIKSIKMKREVDEAFVDLDRADYYPSLAAFGSYSYSGSADDFKFNNYSTAMVGLSFSINLFRGTQTKNRVQQALISVKQTDEQIRQLKDYVSVQVKAKILELGRVKSVIQAQERNVKLAQRAYEIATVRYKEGTGNQLEIQNSDIALRQAKTNLLQSIYDYINSRSELDQLLGSVKDEYISFVQQKIQN